SVRRASRRPLNRSSTERRVDRVRRRLPQSVVVSHRLGLGTGRSSVEGKAVSQTASELGLDPNDVAGWAAQPLEALLALPPAEAEGPQLQALIARFAHLRPRVAALDALATRQGVDRIESFEDAAPLLFDHRV